MEGSLIAWTDHTFNVWWGCTRVSPGCEHCYAETLATQRRKLDVWGVDANRKPMSEAYWREPLRWNRKAEAAGVRARVFCASMADVFELVPDRNSQARLVQTEGRARLRRLIETTPWLDWLLLTKRPENVARLAPWRSGAPGDDRPEWPGNVWLGTTVEDQKRLERLNYLRQIPAAVRFVSYEPALELVDFSAYAADLHWIIVGGESGKGARSFDLAWARRTIETCRAAGIAAFVKQLGANPDQRMVDAAIHGSLADLRHPKGADPAEWPADLRVQEFPRSVACAPR